MQILALDSDAGRIDLYIGTDALPGAAPWDELKTRSGEATVSGLVVPFVGRDDLIAIKRAASSSPTRPEEKRAIDLQDLALLVSHRDELERRARESQDRPRPPADDDLGREL